MPESHWSGKASGKRHNLLRVGLTDLELEAAARLILQGGQP